MECSICEKKKYCDAVKKMPYMFGCASGVPKYDPLEVAQVLTHTIKRAHQTLGLDEGEYLTEIIKASEGILGLSKGSDASNG